MDLAEGEDLSALLRRRHGAPMPPAEVLAILRPLASALDYAHGEKVLHRDVKPGNVKVRPAAAPGSAPRVQLLDFGLAAEVRSSMSRVSVRGHAGTSGTPAYMAPEQWEARRQSAATDQYALAVMAYQMLAGYLPFDADDTDLLRRAVLSRAPQPVPGLSRAANAALLRALAKDPAGRFPSCTAFVEALARATYAPRRRIPAWLAAAALVAVAAGIFLTQGRRGAEQGGGGLQSAVGQSGGGLETASPLAGAREAGARSAVLENREHGKVQLWEGGPYWAETNIGADKPEDSGLYFWWGDTMGYRREGDAWVASDGSSRNFSFGEECTPTLGKSVATLQSTGWVVSKDGTTVPAPTVSMAKLYSWLKGVLSEYGTTVLAPEHDAAYVHWGGDWRMPTGEELSGLSSKCDWTWTTRNRVEGYLVRGRGAYAGASIFLPAAGYGYGTSINSAGSRGRYWSSVPYESNSRRAWNLRFDSGYRYTYDGYRYYGQSVRPVQGFAE